MSLTIAESQEPAMDLPINPAGLQPLDMLAGNVKSLFDVIDGQLHENCNNSVDRPISPVVGNSG